MNQSVVANQVEWQVMLEHYQKKSATEAYFPKFSLLSIKTLPGVVHIRVSQIVKF